MTVPATGSHPHGDRQQSADRDQLSDRLDGRAERISFPSTSSGCDIAKATMLAMALAGTPISQTTSRTSSASPGSVMRSVSSGLTPPGEIIVTQML